jgi:lycopene cyclase domain-containing protein
VTLAYLLVLLLSLGGMVLLDRRFRLFFWRGPARAAIVLGAGLAVFLAWDLAGIALGIFYRGESTLMTGLQLAAELPVEEFFFLAFLCYLTMNVVQGAQLVLSARSGKAGQAR